MLTAICRYGPRIVPETAWIVEECRARGETIQGPDIGRFERAFGAAIGLPDAVAASYGRMAFYYLLKAFAFPAGSEIVFPALTFWVVPEIARGLGLTPVFADVDPVTFNLTPASFKRAITTKTVAVVPTHLWGLPCDMDEIGGIAARHGVAVIEDCAHALFTNYRGHTLGLHGKVGCFSFFSNKNATCGEGGALITDDDGLAARLRLFRSHGMTSLTLDRHRGRAVSYDVVLPGYNHRLDEIRSEVRAGRSPPPIDLALAPPADQAFVERIVSVSFGSMISTSPWHCRSIIDFLSCRNRAASSRRPVRAACATTTCRLVRLSPLEISAN